MEEQHRTAEIYQLGQDYSCSADSSQTQLNNNIIVVGPSGAGKTMSYAEMRLLRTRETSLIVTLSKRRLVTKYLPWFGQHGYRVEDLNLVAPEKSTIFYDPMHYVKTEQDIIYLARSIVMADKRKAVSREADPFWDESAQSLLCALTAYILHVKSHPSFADVADLFAKLRIKDTGEGIETNLDDLFERLNREMPECFAYRCWKTFRFAPMRTASCIYSALSVTMDTVFPVQMLEVMRRLPCIEFHEISDRPTVLFLTTSAVSASLNTFAGLFYAQAVRELFNYAEGRVDGCLPLPVHLLCDDFAVGATIPDFAQYISIFREKGLSVSMLLQSESQLYSMYGENDAITIINNCDRYVYMGGMDLTTCQHIALRLNAPLSEIMYMPLGYEFIFTRGSKPVRTQRYHIMEDPEWQEVTQGQ